MINYINVLDYYLPFYMFYIIQVILLFTYTNWNNLAGKKLSGTFSNVEEFSDKIL